MVADHPSGQDQGRMTWCPSHSNTSPRRSSFKGNVPLSPAVKVGKHVFVSGVPGYDLRGTLAIEYCNGMEAGSG